MLPNLLFQVRSADHISASMFLVVLFPSVAITLFVARTRAVAKDKSLI